MAGNIYLASIRNSSWRSWTITGINLASGKPIQRLPDGSTVALSASYRGMPDFVLGNAAAQRESIPFEIAGNQVVTLTLVMSHAPSCKPPLFQTPKEMQRFNAMATKLSLHVPVVISVATPLGSRNVTTSFGLIDGCP
jgi:hypothetical protein